MSAPKAVAVTSVQQELVPANPGRIEIFIQNLSGAAVYIGIDSTVTTSNGIEIAATTGTWSRQKTDENFWIGAYHIITASSSRDVRVWDVEKHRS
jgi:hypothetical protein